MVPCSEPKVLPSTNCATLKARCPALFCLNFNLIKQKLKYQIMDRFSALRNPTCQAIISLLPDADRRISRPNSLSACRLCPRISGFCREAGLVKVERRGRERIYGLNLEGLESIEQWAVQARKKMTSPAKCAGSGEQEAQTLDTERCTAIERLSEIFGPLYFATAVLWC